MQPGQQPPADSTPATGSTRAAGTTPAQGAMPVEAATPIEAAVPVEAMPARRTGSGSRRNRTLFVVAVTVVAVVAGIAGSGFWTGHSDKQNNAAVRVVRDYLEALRSRDVNRALAIAKTSPASLPGAPATSLLTADAIDPGWRIRKIGWVRAESESGREPRREVYVRVSLTGPSGKTYAPPSDTSGYDLFEVDQYADGWRIKNPFVVRVFPRSPLWYVGLGNARVDYQPNPTGGDKTTYFAMFPGVYTLPGRHSDVVTATAQEFPAIPGVDAVIGTTTVTMTAAGTQRLQHSVDGLLDGCAAEQGGSDPRCRLRIGPVRHGGEEFTDMDIWPVRWSIQRHPTVQADVKDEAIAITFTQPARVKVHATLHDIDRNQRIAVDVTCVVTSISAYAGVTADDTVTARWAVPAGADDNVPHDLQARCD